MSFVPGYNKGVTFTTTTAGTASINVTEHSWSEMIDKLDVTHSGTAGIQALLAGILRGKGNVKANSDDGQIVTNVATAGIRAGTNGVMKFYHFAFNSNPFSVGAMIVQVHFQAVVAGQCQYDFDVELNTLAGSYSVPS